MRLIMNPALFDMSSGNRGDILNGRDFVKCFIKGLQPFDFVCRGIDTQNCQMDGVAGTT